MSTAPESPYVQGVHLQRTDENVREIAALAQVLGEATGLDGVLGDLTYDVRRARVVPRLLGRAVREAYRWDAYDERDRLWYPQGISTSADASDTEAFVTRTGDVRRLVVTTWYSTGEDGVRRGSRVTFVDLDAGRYRHVLLVSPVFDEHGRLTVEPMNIHAGGIVWAGPYLHIAATSRGFVTARVDDIMRVPGDDEHSDRIGIEGTTLHSFGHRYVLPVRLTYRALTDEGHEKLRYSFMSLDRRSEPPALLAGEYAHDPDATTRLARYPLDPQTWQLAVGDDGVSRPLAVDEGGVRQMQGAVIAAGRFHVTVSHGPWLPGTMCAGQPGSMKVRRWALPMGPEDLSYWPSTDRIWSVTEHPRRRWIVAMDRAWFDERAHLPGPVSRWLAVDLLLVGVFAIVGRLSHYGSLSLGGWWTTAWPFLAGTLLAWVTLRATRRPPSAIGSGLVVWAGALLAGMALRQAGGQGTATAFIAVATLVLGAFLVLPRVGARVRRR